VNHGWLKNSDDVGTKFDLLAEVLHNDVVVGSGRERHRQICGTTTVLLTAV
jgi:hypothetical protein